MAPPVDTELSAPRRSSEPALPVDPAPVLIVTSPPDDPVPPWMLIAPPTLFELDPLSPARIDTAAATVDPPEPARMDNSPEEPMLDDPDEIVIAPVSRMELADIMSTPPDA